MPSEERDADLASSDAYPTLLFTDMEGSTRLLAQLGEESYAELLALHDRVIRAEIAQRGGEEVGTEGDSFFVTFSRATDGVVAAASAQRALLTAPWPAGVTVRVRMGLHTGPVARAGGNLVGMAIHTAARIKAAAHGGQVVVSAATAGALDRSCELTLSSLGSHRLRDIGGRLELFQVDQPGLPREFPRLASEPSDFTPVPSYLSGLVDRHDEQISIAKLLDERRIVTITGPPGVGKTRLAAAITNARSDVAFVDLASVDDASLVAIRVAGALGIQLTGDEDPLDTAARQLGDARALLFIDNCEHVVEDVARIVAQATARCGALRVLATSREPLAIDGEVVWSLATLAEATDLFVARVREALPTAQLDAGDARVAEICERLDHLPLAVELAAAQVGRLSLSDLTAWLDQRFTSLPGPRRDAPERHRTLQAAIDWSVRLLSDSERAAFRRLAVMRGPFDYAAAEAVCGEPVSAVIALGERSLLTYEGDAISGRFRMLATIRAYAIEMLDSSGERRGAEEAHARAFHARARERLAGATADVTTLSLIDEDADNYQAALQWLTEHDPVNALDLAIDLEGQWVARLSAPVAARMLKAIVDAATDAPPQLRSHGLVILADVCRAAGLITEARRAAEESIALGGSAVPHAHVSAPLLLAQILALQGELDAAARIFEESLVASRSRGDVADAALSLREIANVAFERNRPDDALAPLDEAAALAASHDEARWMLGWLAADRARVALATGRISEARAAYEESLARAQQLGLARGISGCLLGLAAVERTESSSAHARELVQEAIRIYRDQGDTGGLAHAFVEAALLHSRAGNHERAVQLLAAADAARARIGIVTPGSEEQSIRATRAAAVAALGADVVDQLETHAGRSTIDDAIGMV